MKAVRLAEHGPPDVLRYVDVPTPELGPEDVLVRVRAAAINQWDLRYRAGKLPAALPGRPPWPLPFQLGRDGAGEVVDVGPAVTRWRPGDRVVQMPHPACGRCVSCRRGLDNLCVDIAYPGHQVFGSYAEFVARPQHALLPTPDHVTDEVAGATLWSYATPLHALSRRVPVGPGDTVVVTGASGGIAVACQQLGRLAGATVIGTTTQPGRVDDLRALGYDHVLVTSGEDPAAAAAQVREVTAGLGADAVWDCVGGSAFFALAVACVRLGGAIAMLGAPVTESGFALQTDAMAFVFGELTVCGVRGSGRADQERCLHLLAEGRISPVVDRTFALADAAEAHAYLEGHRQVGKVVLVP